ncbi:hypothetical protein [Psychromonas sp. Urea-02u-13]|uniref:hypothetical protein n=1 Tax=Psychromonas sp. Urea-02u-13 TaxID=2058326 RepID=UPI000C332DB3|nr:hypothetical protein [Psychromonas sp. Urea-02u-13]PKG39620.1 hypothetical protein CXF74_07630 [Psychromonas sp. Urea-02u-13]
MRSFFENSDYFERLVTKPLFYIKPDYELDWKDGKLIESDDSFAKVLNQLLDKLDSIEAPKNYHLHEDILAEYCSLEEPTVYKKGKLWLGQDYGWILENGAYEDIDEVNLTFAILGRVKAAFLRKQNTFDEMEERHRAMLSELLQCFIYHRENA